MTVPVTFLNIHALLCLIGSRIQAHAHVYCSPGVVEGLRNAGMFSYILLQGMSTESSIIHLLSPDIAAVKNSFGMKRLCFRWYEVCIRQLIRFSDVLTEIGDGHLILYTHFG